MSRVGDNGDMACSTNDKEPMKMQLGRRGKERYYGARDWFSMGELDRLENYSLVTATFTKDNKTYYRYVGYLDIDAFDWEGNKPDKIDKEKIKDYESVTNFSENNVMFHNASRITQYLRHLLESAKKSPLVFFTGGKGFRILWIEEELWVTVEQETSYGNKIVEMLKIYFNKLEQELDRSCIPEELKDIRLTQIGGPWIDPSVYNPNCGLKPDVDKHPDTRLFPQRFEGKEEETFRYERDTSLVRDIIDFWKRVASTVPCDKRIPHLVGDSTMTGGGKNKVHKRGSSERNDLKAGQRRIDPENVASLNGALKEIYPDCVEIDTDRSYTYLYQDKYPTYRIVFVGDYCLGGKVNHKTEHSHVKITRKHVWSMCFNDAHKIEKTENKMPPGVLEKVFGIQEKITSPKGIASSDSSPVSVHRSIFDYLKVTHDRFVSGYEFQYDRVNIVKASCGSGKGELMLRIIEQTVRKLKKEEDRIPRIIIPTPRTSLSFNTHLRINSHIDRLHLNEPEYGWDQCLAFHYMEKVSREPLTDQNCLVIQMETLSNTMMERTYDLLILDELVTLLGHFESETMKKKAWGYDTLQTLIKYTPSVLVLDQDYDKKAEEFLVEARTSANDTFCGIHNTYKGYHGDERGHHFMDRKWLIYEDRKIHYNLIVDTLKELRKERKKSGEHRGIAIAFTSKEEMQIAHQMICREVWEDPHQKNCEEVWEPKILQICREHQIPRSENIEQTWLEYDVVMFTPSITVGVDFSVKHFQSMFAIASNTSVTAREFVQQVARIRWTIKDTIHVYLQCVPRNSPLPTEIKDIYNQKIEKIRAPDKSQWHLTTETVVQNKKFINIPKPTPYDRFRAMNLAEINGSRNDFGRVLIDRLEEMESSYARVKRRDHCKEFIERRREARSEIKETKKKMQIDASLPDSNRNMELESKRSARLEPLEPSEHFELEKYQVAQALKVFKKEDIPDEAITNKNFFKQLQNDMAIRKTLKRSREEAIKRNRQETKKNTALMDMSADFHLTRDIDDLLRIAGFDYLKDTEVEDNETRREVGLALVEENIKKEGVHQRITEIFEKYDQGCRKKRKTGEEEEEEKAESEGEKFMKRVASFTKTHLGVRIVKIQAKKDVKEGRKSSEHRWYIDPAHGKSVRDNSKRLLSREPHRTEQDDTMNIEFDPHPWLNSIYSLFAKSRGSK